MTLLSLLFLNILSIPGTTKFYSCYNTASKPQLAQTMLHTSFKKLIPPST